MGEREMGGGGETSRRAGREGKLCLGYKNKQTKINNNKNEQP